jgi:hypothetical protein
MAASVEHSRFEGRFLEEIEAEPAYTYAPSWKTGPVASGWLAGNANANQPGLVHTDIVAGLFNPTGDSQGAHVAATASLSAGPPGERGEPEHFGAWLQEGDPTKPPAGTVGLNFWG